jgi:ligand-binding sensor domain-containing protein
VDKTQPIPEELKHDEATAFLNDEGGGLWIGTRSQGLLQARGGKVVKHFERTSIPSDDVSGLYQDGLGSVWVTTDQGLAQVRNGKVRRFTKQDGLATKQSVLHLRGLFGDVVAGRL